MALKRGAALALIMAVLWSVSPASARDVAVSTDSELADALENAAAGDTVTILPGTYTPKKFNLQASGTGERPIVVRAERLGDVQIRSRHVELFKLNGPHWRFENLEIVGICDTDSRCEHAFHIVGGAHHTVLRGNRIRNFSAAIKANSQNFQGRQSWPNDVLVEGNQIYNDAPRQTRAPTHAIDIVGGRRWVLRDNFIADVGNANPRQASFVAYLKGNSRDGVIERNLIVCEWRHRGGIRVGLSLGGGGSGPARICEDHDCSVEHQDGIIRNNIVMNCPDVGLYLNKARNTKVYNNTMVRTRGIDVRFPASTADIRNNIVDGRIRSRSGGSYEAAGNYVHGDMILDRFWNSSTTDIFADPEAGDFQLRREDLVRSDTAIPDAVTDDFCGRSRTAGARHRGAIDFAAGACDVAARFPVELPTDRRLAADARRFQEAVRHPGKGVPKVRAEARPPNGDIRVRDADGVLAAIRDAVPGDVITLAPGHYELPRTEFRTGGLPEAPIVFRAARLGEVFLKSPNVELFVVAAPHWHFENLDIEGTCRSDSRCEHAFHVVGGADGTVIRGNRLRNFNAAIKGNSAVYREFQRWPRDVLIEGNAMFNDAPRQTGTPAHPIDVVGGSRWVVRDNFIADFARVDGKPAYAAFLKGNSREGIFERNLVVCEWRHRGGSRVGLSLGGGGSGPDRICEGHDCSVEHVGGIIRNNIVMNCPDVGLYLNNAQETAVHNNTILGTRGIDVRFRNSSADIRGNIIAGRIRSRDHGTFTESGNLILGGDASAAHALFVDPAQGDFTARARGRMRGKEDKPLTAEDFCGQVRERDGIGAVALGGDGCDVRVRVPDAGTLASLGMGRAPAEAVGRPWPHFAEFGGPEDHEAVIAGTAPIYQRHRNLSGRPVVRVGPAHELKRPSEAAEVAPSGTVIEIEAGVYAGDAAVWRQNDILIRAVGGRAHLKAGGAHAEGKAIWVIKGDDVTVEGIEFSGAAVRDKNGAGIRQEGRNLTVRNSYFHNNENGILAAGHAGSEILIEDSEFAHNGYGRGRTHNIYINNVARLVVRNSYFHHAKIGHNIKSRANETFVLHNRIMDFADGRSSYLVDVANAGPAYIIGNVLQQGPKTDNSSLIAYGAEGGAEGSFLYVVNNTMVNDRHWGIFVDNRTRYPVLVANNIIVGAGRPLDGAGGLRNNLISANYSVGSIVMHTAKEMKQAVKDLSRLPAILPQVWQMSRGPDAGLVDRKGYDYRLTPRSPAVDRAVDIRSNAGASLRPYWEYHAGGALPRPAASRLDLGAHELSGG